jgi:hypothetical protein
MFEGLKHKGKGYFEIDGKPITYASFKKVDESR